MTKFKSKSNYLLQEVMVMSHKAQQRFLNLLVKSLGCNNTKAQIDNIAIKKMAELASSIDDEQDKYVHEELEKFIRTNNNPPSDAIVRQLEIMVGHYECEEAIKCFKEFMLDVEHQKLSAWISDELSDYPHLSPLFARYLTLLLEVLQICDGEIDLCHTEIVDNLIIVNEMMDWEQDCVYQYINLMIGAIKKATHQTGKIPVGKSKMMAFLMDHLSDLSSKEGATVIDHYFADEMINGVICGRLSRDWIDYELKPVV